MTPSPTQPNTPPWFTGSTTDTGLLPPVAIDPADSPILQPAAGRETGPESAAAGSGIPAHAAPTAEAAEEQPDGSGGVPDPLAERLRQVDEDAIGGTAEYAALAAAAREWLADEQAPPRYPVEPKVRAASVSATTTAALGTVVVWVLTRYAPGLPVEVTAGLSTVLVALATFAATLYAGYRAAHQYRPGELDPVDAERAATVRALLGERR